MTSVLFVGHSLVNTTMPTMADQLLDTETPSTVSYQVINGAPLWWNWENSAQAQGVDGRALLGSTGVDVLVLTEAIPLDNHLQWSNTVDSALNFATLARATNPNTEIFIYETWHDIRSGTGVDVEYDNGDTIPWRECLNQDAAKWQGIATAMTQALDPTAPEVRVVPVGQALGRLADAIEAGTVPGLNSITDLFTDSIHLNATGNYFVALIHYTAITGQSPAGLPDLMLNEWGGTAVDLPNDLSLALQTIAFDSMESLAPWAIDTTAPFNTAPTAIEDSAQTHSGVPILVDVTANDSDVDNDAFVIDSVSTTQNGTVQLKFGGIVYTPNPDFVGTEVLTYTLRDARGMESDTTLTVTVAPPEPASTPPGSGELTSPILGLGLNGIADWSTQIPFIDIFK